MGGVIQVAVRFPKGKVRIVQGWTNSVSWHFTQEKFFEGNPSIWRNYLQQFTRDPYLYEKDDPITSLAPNSYGLIVVDYVTNTIISGNNYTTPGYLDLWNDPLDQETIDLMATGRVYVVGSISRGHELQRVNVSSEDKLKALRLWWKEQTPVVRELWGEVDLSPEWNLEKFNINHVKSETLRMLARLKDLGFKFTQSEIALWDAWVAELSE